jgi:hypothetical protein
VCQDSERADVFSYIRFGRIREEDNVVFLQATVIASALSAQEVSSEKALGM